MQCQTGCSVPSQPQSTCVRTLDSPTSQISQNKTKPLMEDHHNSIKSMTWSPVKQQAKIKNDASNCGTDTQGESLYSVATSLQNQWIYCSSWEGYVVLTCTHRVWWHPYSARDIICKVLEAPPKLYLRGPRFPKRSGSKNNNFWDTWEWYTTAPRPHKCEHAGNKHAGRKRNMSKVLNNATLIMQEV